MTAAGDVPLRDCVDGLHVPAPLFPLLMQQVDQYVDPVAKQLEPRVSLLQLGSKSRVACGDVRSRCLLGVPAVTDRPGEAVGYYAERSWSWCGTPWICR